MTGACKFFSCFLILLCMDCGKSFCQQKDTASGKMDSLPVGEFVKTAKKLANEETNHSLQTYREGRIILAQRHTIDAIKSVSQRIRLYMKDGLDTLAIDNELKETEASLSIARDGIFKNQGTTQTQRNLAVTASIIVELLDNVSEHKIQLDKYTNHLIDYKDNLDSLSSDSSLYFFPADSLAIISYVKRIIVVNKEIGPVDSSLKITINRAQELQMRIDLMIYNLHSLGEDIEIYRSGVSAGVLNRELGNIWGPVGFFRPVREILKFSWAKEKMVLQFYIRDHAGRIFIILLMITAAMIFARSVKKMVQQENLQQPDFNGQLVLRYPVLSSVFVVLNIFQFIFVNPPFIFNICIWSVSIICLTIIFRDVIARYWLRYWWLVIVFFVLTSADNFFLQAARSERWFMLILAAAGVLILLRIFFAGHLKELKEKGLLYFFIFVALVETASFFNNAFGRYNLSKSLLITGYVGIAVAILFFWTIRFINEMLGLAYKVYKFPDKKLFYINFDKVGTDVPNFLYVLLVFGWFIIMGRNFYAFRQIATPVEDFLFKNRAVGESNFSIGGIFIFISILVASLLLSKLISFFATATPSPHGTTKGERIGIGSWLLLIRIFIISLGLFLAFAATGIPVDRLTIILGALGVGVGLGLQSLVTNLVSGLIIAFEKPVNVGDVLEVNGKMATMKSIGFRSSVVKVGDGSHVVIPNGDLLNQHLVNWSMGRNMRRTSVVLGVAYDTDINHAREIFLNVLKGMEHVLQNPHPAVFAKNFGAFSIDFELFFWVGHLSEADAIKSEVIAKIDTACKTAGILIPVPQQDIHIRSMPDEKEKNI